MILLRSNKEVHYTCRLSYGEGYIMQPTFVNVVNRCPEGVLSCLGGLRSVNILYTF